MLSRLCCKGDGTRNEFSSPLFLIPEYLSPHNRKMLDSLPQALDALHKSGQFSAETILAALQKHTEPDDFWA